MGAKIRVLGLMIFFPPYLRSTMVRFPLVIRDLNGGGGFSSEVMRVIHSRTFQNTGEIS